MKKILFAILMGLFCMYVNAQKDSTLIKDRLIQIEQTFRQLAKSQENTEKEFQQLNTQNKLIQRNIDKLFFKSSKLSSQIDSLNYLLQGNSNAIKTLYEQVEEKNKEVNRRISETIETTNKSVSALDKAINKSTLYWIIGILSVAILSIVVFVVLRKKVMNNQSSMVEKLSTFRKELEQEALKLDEKLVRILETQMKTSQEAIKVHHDNLEPDHSLALKVADEIVRIEKNISQMDKTTRGLKQLKKAVERIKDNFASNGYEMVNMLGKPFDDGMKVIANFRPDENLEPGQRIITRIIKPQVNYKGKMIQSAQIEVSQGE